MPRDEIEGGDSRLHLIEHIPKQTAETSFKRIQVPPGYSNPEVIA
jgi:hypothetical protein